MIRARIQVIKRYFCVLRTASNKYILLCFAHGWPMAICCICSMVESGVQALIATFSLSMDTAERYAVRTAFLEIWWFVIHTITGNSVCAYIHVHSCRQHMLVVTGQDDTANGFGSVLEASRLQKHTMLKGRYSSPARRMYTTSICLKTFFIKFLMNLHKNKT